MVTKKKMGARLGAVLIVALLCLPMVSARSWGSPYDQGEVSTNGTGCRLTNAIQERTVGKNHVYAGVCGVGDAQGISRIGSSFRINDNGLLAGKSFSAGASTEIYVKGHMQCLAGGVATLSSGFTAKLQKYRWTGATWAHETETTLVSESCLPGGVIKFVDRTQSGSLGSHNYAAGTTYRLVVESRAWANGLGAGSASSDFCSSGGCGGVGDSARTSVHFLSMPNQAPIVESADQIVLYPLALIQGTVTVSGQGCDFDGTTDRTEVWVTQLSGTHGLSTGSGLICRPATKGYTTPLPGTYTIRTESRDNENALRSDTGTLQVVLVPSTLAANTAGYPDLSTIPESSLGPSVAIQLLHAADGSIRASRVSSGGTTFIDTISTTSIEPGDKTSLLEYNRVLSNAALSLDGVSQWSGAVVEETLSSPWWNIIPVGSNAIDNTPTAGETPVSYTPNYEVPYRAIVPETEESTDSG